jgi:hypothetical protein
LNYLVTVLPSAMIIVIVVAIVSVVSTPVTPLRSTVISIAVISAIVVVVVAVVIVTVEPSVILVRSHFLEATTIVVVVAVVVPIIEHHNPPNTPSPSRIGPGSEPTPMLHDDPPRPGAVADPDGGSNWPTVNTDIGRDSLGMC